MKTWTIRILFALAVLTALFQSALAQQSREAPLTNASVVKLARAGFKESTIIAIIRTRPHQFDLAPDRLIELKKSGVSEKVILAMLAVDDSFADDGWSDDPFFKDSLGAGRDGNNQSGGGNTADIFGSSGGSRGRTRNNTGRGGSSDDTETTGSATVKIIRPPAESGSGAASTQPRMERTPTLTNNSIIELVEAGFSEGTIIRRIEQSPVEFDLSADKLKELRRRRVTEAIINAMTAAMSDGPVEKRATQ
jgi:hypothetical protein